MQSGIRRVRTIVPHDPHVTVRDGDVEGDVRAGAAGLEIGLIENDSVDAYRTGAIGHDVIAREPDDPLDEMVPRVLRQDAQEDQHILGETSGSGRLGIGEPVIRVGEHHDVTVLDGIGVVQSDQDAVARVEGVLHGSRGNGVALHEQSAHNRDDRQYDDESQQSAQKGAAGLPPASLAAQSF